MLKSSHIHGPTHPHTKYIAWPHATKTEYIACPHATQRQNPRVNQAIKNLFIPAHEMDRTNEFFLN